MSGSASSSPSAEPTRETAANQGGPSDLTALPTGRVVGDLLSIFSGPRGHLHDDVRRVVEAALVQARSEGFRDGKTYIQREVKRVLSI